MPELDNLFQMIHGQNSGLIQSILLILIWLNVRSLKKAFIKLEEGHDKRILALEIDMQNVKGQLTVRHQTIQGV